MTEEERKRLEEEQAAKAYDPLNKNNYKGPGYDAQVEIKKAEIKENPNIVKPLTDKETIFADVPKNPNNGYMTTDWDEAQKSADFYNVGVTAYGGYEDGQPRYFVDRAPREEKEGHSNADAGNLSQQDYDYVRYAQDQWAITDAAYKEALDAGNTELANQLLATRDGWHDTAERIRAGRGYSGGTDGSMYIDFKLQGIPYGNNATGKSDGGSGASSASEDSTPDAPALVANDYSSYISAMMEAKRQADEAALLEAYELNKAAIDRAGVGLEDAYQDARNQTAGASDLAARNFNERAAALGLNSGAGGQAELSRNVALQNDMNTINRQEAQSFADLEQQYAQNEASYNSAIAQARAEGNLQEAQMLYEEKVRVESANIELMQQAFQNELTLYQLQYQQMRDSVADEQWKQTLDLQYQQWMNDAEVQWAQLEMQKQSLDAELKQIDASLTQQQFENELALRKLSEGGTQETKMSLSTAKDLAEQGFMNNNIRQTLYNNGYTDDIINQLYGTPDAPTGEEYGSGYTGAVATARIMQAEGKTAGEIFDYLEGIDPSSLTTTGLDSILSVLKIGGY